MVQISAVLFDLGNVLFHFTPQKRLKNMSSASGIAEETLRQILWESGFSDDCDAGIYTAQEMYQKACDLLQWYPDYAQFKNLWTSAFELNHQVFSIAKRIQPKIPVGILSNNPQILRETLQENYQQVEALFKPIIFSSQHKTSKPQSGIFLKAVEIVDCPTDEILFIDDSQKYIEAAAKSRMQTIHFTTSDMLLAQLEIRDILS